MKILALLLACLPLFADVSKLRVYQENDPAHLLVQTSTPDEIAFLLHMIDVRFEQWQANQELSPNCDSANILKAYQSDVDKLVQENGYRSVDVIRVLPDHPQKERGRTRDGS